jgi:hypothetical protein
LLPRQFSRWFGVPVAAGPFGDALIRSISARDAINGAGILSATLHQGRVAPWILARGVADTTDTLAIALAWAQGARNARFAGLGLVAFGAAVYDWLLYAAHRSAARQVA